jgi:hypothetical protein
MVDTFLSFVLNFDLSMAILDYRVGDDGGYALWFDSEKSVDFGGDICFEALEFRESFLTPVMKSGGGPFLCTEEISEISSP